MANKMAVTNSLAELNYTTEYTITGTGSNAPVKGEIQPGQYAIVDLDALGQAPPYDVTLQCSDIATRRGLPSGDVLVSFAYKPDNGGATVVVRTPVTEP